ncbi:ABC transporter permease [Variovorax sp. RT4R15]|uniref:ABC transporter permease n=1 Tax=Variovorax sp. RT4R15 TaxID=3443737 RepID=UPI003F486BD6
MTGRFVAAGGRLSYPIAGVILLLTVWQLVCMIWAVPTAVLPTPVKVAYAFAEHWQAIVEEGWVTLKATFYGFALSLVLGIPLAVAVTSFRWVNLTFYPLLVALQSVPKVALAPILLVWLGTGMSSKLALAWLVAFFPVVVDTAAGLQSTPKELLELARSLRASRWQVFRMVRFPAALPFVITGAKVAVTLSLIGAVIGEFVGAGEGLGFLLLSATSQINTPLAFAALFGLSFMGMAVYLLVVLGEQALSAWLPPPPSH